MCAMYQVGGVTGSMDKCPLVMCNIIDNICQYHDNKYNQYVTTCAHMDKTNGQLLFW